MDTKREHRTHAEGSPRGKPCDLTYSPSGRLIGKFRDNNSVTLSATVDMAYGYCDDYQPHAAKRMFEFTGKELDEETGYGYFGARYYDPTILTSWTAVDPMADKYPSLSPYNYCAWNPMKLVDPDGNEAIDICDWYRDQTGVVVWDDEVKSQEDLTQGCTYLGTEGVAVNEHGDVTRVYNSDGTTEEIPQTLSPVTITENKNHCSADIAANIPAALTVALYDGPELGPADLLAGVVTGALAIASAICWIYDIITAPAVDESYIEQYNEHTKGTRNSTYDKHTKRRSGQVTGKQRNENRGDKNRKYQPKLNPNKKSKNES